MSNIIKVIGVGGGGGNAANYMYENGIYEVDFVVCNTDSKALDMSPIESKIRMGEKGLGAGSKPEVGCQAAIEAMSEIEKELEGTEMVFVTAGMGGGTGTGAAPVIAKAAKDKDILTIGIVTIPFVFEGQKRLKQALIGLDKMRKSVDAMIIITNERIKELYGKMSLSQAFHKADNVLATAAKGIAELITVPGYINVDMEDVRTVLKDSGDAIMGCAMTNGENRAEEAIKQALSSPLLINSDISSSENVLINISSGIGDYEVTMDEVTIITDYLKSQLKPGAQMIWGTTMSESLGDMLQITIVVTGLNLTDEEIASDKPMSKPVIKKPQTDSKFVEGLFGDKETEKTPAENKNEDLSEEALNNLAKNVYGKDVLNPSNTKTNQEGYKPYVFQNVDQSGLYSQLGTQSGNEQPTGSNQSNPVQAQIPQQPVQTANSFNGANGFNFTQPQTNQQPVSPQQATQPGYQQPVQQTQGSEFTQQLFNNTQAEPAKIKISLDDDIDDNYLDSEIRKISDDSNKFSI